MNKEKILEIADALERKAKGEIVLDSEDGRLEFNMDHLLMQVEAHQVDQREQAQETEGHANLDGTEPGCTVAGNQ